MIIADLLAELQVHVESIDIANGMSDHCYMSTAMQTTNSHTTSHLHHWIASSFLICVASKSCCAQIVHERSCAQQFHFYIFAFLATPGLPWSNYGVWVALAW